MTTIELEAPNQVSRPDLVQLLAETKVAMEADGVSVKKLDPFQAMLALHRPALIEEAWSRSTIAHGRAVYERKQVALTEAEVNAGRPLTYEEADAVRAAVDTRTDQRDAFETTDKLTSRLAMRSLGRRATRAVFWLAGVSATVAMLAGSDRHDPSILSGDGSEIMGGQFIPGLPDPNSEEVTSSREVIIDYTDVEETSSYAADDESVTNPVADNLGLTGHEYDLAVAAAEGMLSEYDENLVIEEALVTAIVSDEFEGEWGGYDEKQEPLGDARADVGRKALEDVAAERGIEIEEIDATSVQTVLDADQIEAFDELARKHGFSSHVELTAAYDNGQLPPALQAELAQTPYLKRGVDFSITGHVKERTVRSEESAEQETKISLVGVSSEFALLFLGTIGIVGEAIARRRQGKRTPAHRFARRAAKEAGLTVPSRKALKRAAKQRRTAQGAPDTSAAA